MIRTSCKFMFFCITVFFLSNLAKADDHPLVPKSETQTTSPNIPMKKMEEKDRYDLMIKWCFFQFPKSSISDIRIKEGTANGFISQKPSAIRTPYYSFFTDGEFSFGDEKLIATADSWNCDQLNKIPKPVEVLFQPTVLLSTAAQSDGKFDFIREGIVPLEYFVKRQDGLFELNQVAEKAGVNISGQIIYKSKEKIFLHHLLIRCCTIDKREHVEGVHLEIGKPIVKKEIFGDNLTIPKNLSWEKLSDTSINRNVLFPLKPKVNYGILMVEDYDSAILCRLYMELVPNNPAK